jgi:hypothetical protein
MIDNLVTVDPGFDGTGWSYWSRLWVPDDFSSEGAADYGFLHPQDTGVIRLTKADKEKHWMTRAVVISSAFGSVLQELVPKQWSKATVMVELPEFFASSAVGHAAAVKGDLTVLTVLSGMILRVAWDCGWNAGTLSPTEWKGQMNKKALKARIGRALNTVYRDHEADAVGMGLHLAGQL